MPLPVLHGVHPPGGGVGIGRSIHAGQVSVADGSLLAAQKLERVLANDPLTGVLRHVDAGYPTRGATQRPMGSRSRCGGRRLSVSLFECVPKFLRGQGRGQDRPHRGRSARQLRGECPRPNRTPTQTLRRHLVGEGPGLIDAVLRMMRVATKLNRPDEPPREHPRMGATMWSPSCPWARPRRTGSRARRGLLPRGYGTSCRSPSTCRRRCPRARAPGSCQGALRAVRSHPRHDRPDPARRPISASRGCIRQRESLVSARDRAHRVQRLSVHTGGGGGKAGCQGRPGTRRRSLRGEGARLRHPERQRPRYR